MNSELAPGLPIDPSSGLTSAPFLTSTFQHIKSSASNVTSSFNSSALFVNMPRWFGPLTDRLPWLQLGGSTIAEATGSRAIGMDTLLRGSTAGAQGAAASAAVGGATTEQAATNALPQAWTFNYVRNWGGIFTYMTSKWALACFTLAVVLNRTRVLASGRRQLRLTFPLRLALRIAPIILFVFHAQSLLQAMRCQTSPDYPLLKYGDPSKQFDLDFAARGGILYRLSSSVLFWQSDKDACQAVEMVRTRPESTFKGSSSLLWPLFKTLCVGQFVETLSCSVQGRPIQTETGMSVFEQSLAFAEAEAMLSSELGLNLLGFPRMNATKTMAEARESSSSAVSLTKSELFEKLNVTPEVLLMGLISCLNNLSSHLLAVFNLQNRFRLVNTGIWGLCFMSSFVWGFFAYRPTTLADGIILHFPTVCIVGFIPHVLVLLGIIACGCIYLIALCLAILSPPLGSRPSSWKERFNVAYNNLQANAHFSTIRLNMHEDFYTALLKVGFATLTIASEAVFLNEGERIGVHRWTWLEEERLKEIRETTDFARERLDFEDAAIVAGGVAITEVRPANMSRRWKSGYAREKTTKSLKNAPGTSARAEADGVGALQRSGRYVGAWELLSGTFWLVTGWMALLGIKALRRAGIKRFPAWAQPKHSDDCPKKRKSGQSHDRDSPQQKPLEFWILSDDGELSLPEDDHIDVEKETKKRLRLTSDSWGAKEERDLDSALYNWWAHGGWWGDRDDSGDYTNTNTDDNDDLTSEVSLSETHTDDQGDWESDNDESNDGNNGQRTPTQRSPHPASSRESTPFPDHALDTTELIRLLNPQDLVQRQESQMLAHHLSSDRIVTRSAYRRSQGHNRYHLLTSNPFNRNLGSQPGRLDGPLSKEEEASILEHLILSKRGPSSSSEQHSDTSKGPNLRVHGQEPTTNPQSSWQQGGEGLGSSGPQCVVCQSAPRTVLSWPCRCLSLCEECRDVVGFSRLFVP
ncbi:MAG: hypothetical protein Q9220_001673 [cf. Caloplaca sp. 1 TL-2023]